MTKVETRYHFKPGMRPVVSEGEKLPRAGIYSASFDPVHAGHIIFALKAQRIAELEKVYFIPERKPERHEEPEHYTHRSAMLGAALKPYRQFETFDLPDARLTSRSFARVADALPRADFSLLTTASDLLWRQGELPALYRRLHLVIAVTSHAQMAEVLTRLTDSEHLFRNVTFIDIGTDHISSTVIRQSIRSGQPARGVLPSVWRYARKQWLYLPPIRRERS
ncbi:MAG TPA: hypothetical protein VMB52_02055 [Verrucomicrobiae bacterium]|nr:hypothetical protein [Verrucomicrobiae bacterium]